MHSILLSNKIENAHCKCFYTFLWFLQTNILAYLVIKENFLIKMQIERKYKMALLLFIDWNVVQELGKCPKKTTLKLKNNSKRPRMMIIQILFSICFRFQSYINCTKFMCNYKIILVQKKIVCFLFRNCIYVLSVIIYNKQISTAHLRTCWPLSSI